MEHDVKIDVYTDLTDSELEGSDEGEVGENLDANTVVLEKSDRSLAELKRWYDDGDLIIDPEWQRNYVWNNKQASKLIESFLLNIPVPVVYLARADDGKYEVIDGLQRLKSVFMFLDNTLQLNGLDFLGKYNKCRYKDLEADVQRKIRNSTLRSFELASNSNTNLHFVVFERLNTGGTKLNEMEIRNCIFRGKLNDLIKSLAEITEFISSVGQKNLSKRMDDRNLVLRFLAFYEKTYHKYDGGLKKFLNDFLDIYRDPPEHKLQEYNSIFEKCMRSSRIVFGNRGFRLKVDAQNQSNSIGEWSTRINMPIFQCVATSFSKYDIGQITRNADSIYEEYIDLISTDRRWVENVRRATSEATRLKYVFSTWENRLAQVMEDTVPNDSQRLFSKQLKNELFSQNRTCTICGQEIQLIDDSALDHIQHYWRGGKTIPDNARLVHRRCNLERGRR